MFESVATLGEDDLELDNSFAPIFSSTQDSYCQKRQNEESKEIPKKIKLETKVSPFLRTTSSEHKNNSIYSPNNVTKRIFPGPAGLLGDHFKSFNQQSEFIRKNYIEDEEDFPFCSQATSATFAEGPWKLMKEDFNTVNGEQLYEKYTISWIKKNYSHKKLLDIYKTPFLAAVIQNLDTVDGESPSVHVTLRDTTGVIEATILYSFYKENAAYLTTGSVIVLKPIGVLTSLESHCLTITAGNLLVIYHQKESNVDEGPTNENSIKKIVLQPSTTEEIWKEANSCDLMKNKTNSSKSINNNKPQFSNVYSNYNKLSSVSVSNTNDSLLAVPKVIANMSVSQSNITNAASQNNVKKKFDFKNNIKKTELSDISDAKNNVRYCNSPLPQNNEKDTEIWKTMLEDVDEDLLFGDF